MVCPLWPLHLFVMYILTLCPMWLIFTGMAAAAGKATWWNVTFHPDRVDKLPEGTELPVWFWTYEPLGDKFANGAIEISVLDDDIAALTDGPVNGSSAVTAAAAMAAPDEDDGSTIIVPVHHPSSKLIYLNASASLTSLPLNLSFALCGQFLGYTSVRVRAYTGPSAAPMLESDPLKVSVVRVIRTVDKVFVFAVAILMGLNYINMGCSLDLDVVKGTLLRPIGPVVGLLSQYIFMPLISFGLAYVFFEQPALRLGLFTSGCSPGGGASNMWTYLLEGNLNLSITMTFFSNVFAFATMPFWLFTLGRVVFQESQINIPYTNIVVYVVALVLPVGIGILMQLYLPRVAKVCRRILGPFSVAMILFIVVFGIYTNLFMFKLLTWQLFCAGFAVPFLGYLFGAIAARLLRFPGPDITAISIETGVQNTGVAIVLLRLTLPQPEADLTSVVPIVLATMTPLPLLVAMVIIKINKHRQKANKKYTLAPTSTPTPSDDETASLNPPVVNGKAAVTEAPPAIIINEARANGDRY